MSHPKKIITHNKISQLDITKNFPLERHNIWTLLKLLFRDIIKSFDYKKLLVDTWPNLTLKKLHTYILKTSNKIFRHNKIFSLEWSKTSNIASNISSNIISKFFSIKRHNKNFIHNKILRQWYSRHNFTLMTVVLIF
jgi:hypothetical protein